MAYERKIKITSTLNEAFKCYKESGGKLDKKTYTQIAHDMTETISDMIIRKSFEYKIPYRLGFLRIRKTKQKLKTRNGRIDVNKNIIDWKATWDAWYEIYPGKTRKEIKLIKDKGVIFQRNEHTDGYIMRWYWDKSLCNIPNNTTYMFKPVKGGIINEKYRGRLGLTKWINSEDRRNDWFE